MTEIVNQTPTVSWEMDASGPVPMKWYITTADGVPTARPLDIVCEITYPGQPSLLLAVGSGIVLQSVESVSNAQVVTTPLASQLASYPIGATVTAEWREGTPGAVVLRGNLIIM